MKRAISGIVFFALCGTSMAQTEDDWESWPLADRFKVSAEAFFPSIDTKVRLDAPNGEIGTTIDFEQNLGMSEAETLPAFGFAWRFAKRHKLLLDHFDLSRSGSAVTTSEIRFGDQVFQADLPIASFFDAKVTSIGYSYSLLFDERKDLSLSAGLSVQDIGFGLIGTGNVGVIEQQAGLTAPLPAFGLVGAYAFTDKWIGRLGFGYFAFSLSFDQGPDLSGDIVNGMASIEHQTFENVYFELKYSYFDVKVDFSDSGRLSGLKYQYHGPALAINFVF